MAAEKQFENKVKRFLEDRGCWFLKTWGGGMQRSGIPDLLVCCNGYFFGIELKAPRGKPSELQKWNIRGILKAYGVGIVLYPDQFEDFKAVVDCLFRDDLENADKLVTRINERSEIYESFLFESIDV